MVYGVFILVNGNWKLHQTYVNEICAMQEKNYIVNMLGLTATIFVK